MWKGFYGIHEDKSIENPIDERELAFLCREFGHVHTEVYLDWWGRVLELNALCRALQIEGDYVAFCFAIGSESFGLYH